jgi:hypothetical protein
MERIKYKYSHWNGPGSVPVLVSTEMPITKDHVLIAKLNDALSNTPIMENASKMKLTHLEKSFIDRYCPVNEEALENNQILT